MDPMYAQILTLLTEVILPKLESIHASQTDQRRETERLNRNIEEFRMEMQMRFSAIHVEIAACRQELEDTLVTIHECDATSDPAEVQSRGRKRTIH